MSPFHAGANKHALLSTQSGSQSVISRSTVPPRATFYSLSPLQPPPWWLVRVCEKSIGRCLTRDRLTVRDCMYPCGWVAAGPWCLAKQRTVSTRAQISGDFAVQVPTDVKSSQVKSRCDRTQRPCRQRTYNCTRARGRRRGAAGRCRIVARRAPHCTAARPPRSSDTPMHAGRDSSWSLNSLPTRMYLS